MQHRHPSNDVACLKRMVAVECILMGRVVQDSNREVGRRVPIRNVNLYIRGGEGGGDGGGGDGGGGDGGGGDGG
eukprot:6685028-Prymnesium_polylepis.1